MARILVADHLPERRDILCTFLRGEDHVIIAAAREDDVLKLMREVHPELVIIEGSLSGMKVLAEAREYDPAVGVIMIMPNNPEVAKVVELMNQGVSDFLVSPLNINEVQTKVERALISRPSLDAVRVRFHDLVGPSQKMQQVFRRIVKVATADSSVLIIGERGTGKQLVAREIHQLSSRKDKPFKVVRCAGSSKTELESEMFGHEPRALPWAVERRRGQFELTEGGTIFLDEVAELDPQMQTKLLCFLEERTIQPLGGDRTFTVDVRVLGGSGDLLTKKIQEGAFREDLYYRLATNQIELPPLRARVSDIPELVDHFLARYEVQIAGEAMEVLMNYSWPGNVDELKSAVEQAVTLCEGNRIELKDLPVRVLKSVSTAGRRHKYIPKSENHR